MLGIWLAKTPLEAATAGESARFWASVTADLRNRGVRDILIACCDGLAGFEDAIHAAFPATVVQTCVVHLIRNSLRPVARRDAAAVACELRKVYTAVDADAAFDALAAFAASPLDKSTPRRSRSGRTPGTGSPRSWPSPRASESCSTPPTASSRSTTSCARSPRPAATSPATTPSSSSCGWPSSTALVTPYQRAMLCHQSRGGRVRVTAVLVGVLGCADRQEVCAYWGDLAYCHLPRRTQAGVVGEAGGDEFGEFGGQGAEQAPLAGGPADGEGVEGWDGDCADRAS